MRATHQTLTQRLNALQQYLWYVKDYKPLLGGTDFVRRHLAGNRNTDPNHFIADPHVDVRMAVALRDLTLQQQEILITDPVPRVRKMLACHTNEISIWWQLAKDPELEVRLWVAGQREIPFEVQEFLLLDTDLVRQQLARNPRTAQSVYQKLHP